MRVFLSAGEYSGDILAAELFVQLKVINKNIQASGVVGPHMISAGVDSFLNIESLSCMGLWEVVRALGRLRMLQSELITKILRFRPQVAILVDFPGFHLKLAELLKLHGILVIQYVAPKIWAWGENRAYRLQDQVDHILGILPFEESFFKKFKLKCHYVGTPIYDRIVSHKKKFSTSCKTDLIISFFPGSRRQELIKHLPIIVDVIGMLARKKSKVKFLIHLAPSLQKKSLKTCSESVCFC